MRILNKIYEKAKNFIKEDYKFILLLIFLFLIFTVELPYVIYTPGGSIDLEKRIVIEDGYDSEGKLSMAYVTMVKGALPYILVSKIIPNWDMETKENITYDNESLKEMIKRDKIYLEEAIANATINAYNKAGKTVNISKKFLHITFVTSEADTNIKIEDILLKADGVKISSLDEYREIVNAKKEGDTIKLTVLRDNKEKTSTAKIYNTEEGLRTGLAIVTTYEYETKPSIKVKSKNTESGPSGGLMLALGIYNALVPEDITKGYNIIGTGTIDEDGNVGPIGGVKYKLIGAVRRHADVFICPEENYEEALQVKKNNKYRIKIIKAVTFEGTIEELSNLKI